MLAFFAFLVVLGTLIDVIRRSKTKENKRSSPTNESPATYTKAVPVYANVATIEHVSVQLDSGGICLFNMSWLTPLSEH